MEPRGDRVYAIGFEQGSDQSVAGSLHVSLFDVHDLANPVMLDRVNFGGDWGNFAEDQDRIHKSFRLLEEQGMIVVPYSGWDSTDSCNSTYGSGIQLVDYTRDDLTLRGSAPQIGEARRAFVHRDALFGVSDDAIQTFDISNRDAIQKLDTLETARNITTVRAVGDKVLRFGTDWWTERTVLDVASKAQVSAADLQTQLDLGSVLDEVDDCNQSGYWGNVYVNGEYAYIERYTNEYDYDSTEYKSTQTLRFFVVDLGGASPHVVDVFAAEPVISEDRLYSYHAGVVQTDSALLVEVVTTQYDEDYSNAITTHHYQVVDTRDAAHPVDAARFELPESLTGSGWGHFFVGCMIDSAWGWRGYSSYYYGDRQSTALGSG